MKLKLKEDPKEWRKAAWMSALGLAVMSTILRWRHVLPEAVWCWVLALLAAAAVAAAARPEWFRGYYRGSSKLGFVISQMLGRVVLAAFFALVITPVGLVLRMFGKDPLRLKRPTGKESHWRDARKSSPLDGMF